MMTISNSPATTPAIPMISSMVMLKGDDLMEDKITSWQMSPVVSGVQLQLKLP